MTNFFSDLPFPIAERIEQLSRLMYELRRNRTGLLQQYQATSETDLLEAIRDRRLQEHPSYEAYLGASILTATIEAAREELQAIIKSQEI